MSLLAHVIPLLLVMFRLSGVFVIAPVVASTMIPARVRVLLCGALALCVYPTLRIDPAGVPTDLPGLALACAGEVLLGFVIGLLGLLPVAAVQLAGTIMGQQIGFGFGSLYNPALETDSDILGELLLQLALGVFLAMGGLEALFVATANTFARVPVGGVGTADAPLGMILQVAGAGMELALRVSTPVVALIMVETVASGLVMKTMPQLNIYSIGFATKILLGLGAIVWGLSAMDSAIGEHVSETLRGVLFWSAHTAGGA